MSDRDCQKMRLQVALLPGGDLPLNEARAVRQHLEGCRVCQRLLGDQLRARAIVRELSPERVDPETLLHSVTPLGTSFASDPFFDSLKHDIMTSVGQEKVPMPVGSSRLAQAMTLAAMLLLALYLVPFGSDEDGRSDFAPFEEPMAGSWSFSSDPNLNAGAKNVGMPVVPPGVIGPGLMGREQALRNNLDLDRLQILGGTEIRTEGGRLRVRVRRSKKTGR